MIGEWHIRIVDVGYKTSREVNIFRMTPQGKEMLGSDQIIKEGEVSSKPTMELEPEQLQALADELEKIGYKPQKGFMEGKLEATEIHLKDMRTMLKLK